jgi:DTW domain-containing protein YfiP
LAALGLRNVQLLVGEVFEQLDTHLQQPGYQPYLLFPGEHAQPLAATAATQPMLLVVPDGTWRKARKLLHLNPAVSALPRVVLAAGLQSRYRLRKAPMPGALSTIEAIVEALNTLEAPARFDALLKPFDALIEWQIEAMGEQTFQRNHGREISG